MTYQEAKEHKSALEDAVNNLSKQLNDFPKNSIGLVVDEVRNTEEYQQLKGQYNTAFKELQTFNTYFLKTFKKEYAKERQNKRILMEQEIDESEEEIKKSQKSIVCTVVTK